MLNANVEEKKKKERKKKHKSYTDVNSSYKKMK